MKRALVIALAASLCGPVLAHAGSFVVTVKDSKGVPVLDAVVYAEPLVGDKQKSKAQSAVIDQQNQQFVPYVSAIEAGTAVRFPNKDNIRHHVYSFSPAKKFELPLYAGIPAEPVVFEQPGVVTLGCNIHDWMLAYVAVLGTPHFQITRADGRVTLMGLPAGSYKLEVWQPRMKATSGQLAQTIDLGGAENKEVSFALDLKPDFRIKKAPSLNPEGYR
ncbi:MAG: methylamine utilization protein [Chthoniobacterales bacterium]|nr:methylamine utilization protein [Chthoniobacterales bacterium]